MIERKAWSSIEFNIRYQLHSRLRAIRPYATPLYAAREWANRYRKCQPLKKGDTPSATYQLQEENHDPTRDHPGTLYGRLQRAIRRYRGLVANPRPPLLLGAARAPHRTRSGLRKAGRPLPRPAGPLHLG